MVNIKKETSLKKRVMSVLLLVQVSVLVVVGIKPVQASNLMAYAQAYARAPGGVPFISQNGPNPWGVAYAAASTAPIVNVVSSVSGYVKPDSLGNTRGGPLFVYVSINGGGNGSVLTWFDPASAFFYDDGGIEVWATCFGGTIRGIVGMTVRDDTGLLLDVRMECGFAGGGPYLNVIENIGRWPNNWETVVWTSNNFVLRQRSFSLGFTPTGNANATWYATGQVNSSEGESLKILKSSGMWQHSAYELFGPRLDKLLFKLYSSVCAEFTALENGEIDVIDSPLTQYWIDRWSSDPTIVLSFYGSGWKAYRKQYTGGTAGIPVFPDDGENIYRGRNWTNLVNQYLFGVNSWGTFLGAHPDGFERGDGQNMTIRCGLSSPSLHMLNPIYSTSYWEWQVLDEIYDTMVIYDAFDPSKSIPWLAEQYEVSTYMHPVFGPCTRIKIKLRADLTWADGTQLTTADVYFTLKQLKDILATKGFPPPTWIENVQHILDFEIHDPYNFEVLLDVTSTSALDWIGAVPILPKNIWKPIVETEDPTAFAPDANLIGSGPWRFAEYVENSHILMAANRPSSNVTTNLDGSVPIASPCGYWRYHPLSSSLQIDGGTRAKLDYYIQPHTLDFKLQNLWYSGPIAINLSMSWIYPNGTSRNVTENGITLNASGQPGDTFIYSTTELIKGEVEFIARVTSQEESAAFEILHHYYFHTLWGTITEDICGEGLKEQRRYEQDFVGDGKTDTWTLDHWPIKSGAITVTVDGKHVWINVGEGEGTFTILNEIPAEGAKIHVTYVVDPTIDLQTPDIKVDIKDVAMAAKAFGSYPGHAHWNTYADINRDYKIDIKDIAAIAKKFGWKG